MNGALGFLVEISEAVGRIVFGLDLLSVYRT